MDLILLVGEASPEPYRALEAGGERLVLPLPCPDWNRDLSPWPAPPAFRKGGAFAGGADAFLQDVLARMAGTERALPCPVRFRWIAGYSLGGLFALWALTRTPLFHGAACASSSLWYPDFLPYLRSHPPLDPRAAVALSLGDREAATRNPVLAQVETRTRETEAFLKSRGFPCSLRMEEGTHFTDGEGRLLRAVQDLMRLADPGD